MNTLKSSLQELQTQHEELSHSVEYGRVRQQVCGSGGVRCVGEGMELLCQLGPAKLDKATIL